MEIQCPQCQKLLRVSDEAANKRVRCPSCQTIISLSGSAPQGAPPATPPVRGATGSDFPVMATAKTDGGSQFDFSNPYASPQSAAGGGSSARGRSIPNHLPLAIFSLICCGGLFAVPAIIYAAQANTLKGRGDYVGAAKAASTAQIWLYVAFGIGIVATILSVALKVAVQQ